VVLLVLVLVLVLVDDWMHTPTGGRYLPLCDTITPLFTVSVPVPTTVSVSTPARGACSILIATLAMVLQCCVSEVLLNLSVLLLDLVLVLELVLVLVG